MCGFGLGLWRALLTLRTWGIPVYCVDRQLQTNVGADTPTRPGRHMDIIPVVIVRAFHSVPALTGLAQLVVGE